MNIYISMTFHEEEDAFIHHIIAQLQLGRDLMTFWFMGPAPACCYISREFMIICCVLLQPW